MSPTTANTATQPPCIQGLELQETIGDRGTSVVFRAVHRNHQRLVAVKLRCGRVDAATTSPICLQESRLMASLAHQHVVGIHDAGQVDAHNDFVTGPAASRIRGRRVPSSLEPNQAATDQVWVDDVALFVLSPGSKP